MTKKTKERGISAWGHKVGKPKLTKRNKLREATLTEKRSFPLVFELASSNMEKLSPESIQAIIEKLHGTSAYTRMGRSGLGALRRFLKAHHIKDWTR